MADARGFCGRWNYGRKFKMGNYTKRKALESRNLSFFRERMVTMEEIMMSGKEYLLYLRARQEQMKAYVLECFKEAMNGKLSEQELFEMVEEKFRCELPVDDPENVILKGILTNMLDWYEVQGYLAPVSIKNGPGYRLNRKKLKQAA